MGRVHRPLLKLTSEVDWGSKVHTGGYGALDAPFRFLGSSRLIYDMHTPDHGALDAPF